MSNDKMSPEMQIAIRRSPDYTAPSAEVFDLQVRLDAANARADKLAAEVEQWRRAVRWRKTSDMIYVLRFDSPQVGRQYDLAAVSKYPDGWIGWVDGRFQRGPLPDRDIVCAKVCELLGLPVVLPVGGE